MCAREHMCGRILSLAANTPSASLVLRHRTTVPLRLQVLTMKTALFVDFDNVYSGLRRISAQSADRFARRPAAWLRWLTEAFGAQADLDEALNRRRVLVRRCYLNPVTYHPFRRPFHEAGFEIVDCPPMTAAGKTTTDIHLVLDTMDALADRTHFDEFIVFSADADFSPVLRRLRRHDRRTVVFAAGAMSEAYKASADCVIGIPEFLRDALELGAEDGDEPTSAPADSAVATAAANGHGLRQSIADRVRQLVMEAPAPVALPYIASTLQREFPALRDGRWAGAGSFGTLMRQLAMPGVIIDFPGDTAIDQSRLQPADPRAVPMDRPQVGAAAEGLSPAEEESPLPSSSATADDLDQVVTQAVRRLVSASDRPLLLSMLGQQLRRVVPELSNGWNGAPTLASLLKRLDLVPIQRAVLEDGSTVVLFDPARHSNPTDVVDDPLVAAMLRAAEVPAIRADELRLVLHHARQYMGAAEPFEISPVSKQVHDALASQGVTVSTRRVGAVLQALIFGGLETSATFGSTDELVAAALGVILAAWSRETQAPVDDEARFRLLNWLNPRAAG